MPHVPDCDREPSCLVRWSTVADPPVDLIAIPHAGAGAAAYRGWAAALSGVGVYGVRFAGRESRISDAPTTTMADAVNEVALALASRRSDVPVLLFGQCSGALVAFEVARELQRTGGRPISRLVISGQVPPRRLFDDLRTAGPTDDVERRLREAGEVSDELWDHPELVEIVLVAAAADFAVLDSYEYVPEARLTCPITALVGERDFEIAPKDLDGWGQETASAFDCRVLAGGHLPDETALIAEFERHLPYGT